MKTWYLLCACAVLAACEVGEGASNPDGGGGGGDGGGTGLMLCKQAVDPVPQNGHHNAGQACMQGGCHGTGTGAREFSAGGTAYTTSGGGTPRGGAMVVFRNAADDAEITAVPVHSDGNFYVYAATAIPAGAKTYIAECTSASGNVKRMNTALGAGDGDCNKGGCHVAGQGVGAVWLP